MSTIFKAFLLGKIKSCDPLSAPPLKNKYTSSLHISSPVNYLVTSYDSEKNIHFL